MEEALQKGPFDVAIFAMKSFDTAAALEEIKPFKDKVPPILCLQNGVDNEPAIAAALGPDHVIPGTITVVVARLAAGDIVLEKGVWDGDHSRVPTFGPAGGCNEYSRVKTHAFTLMQRI